MKSNIELSRMPLIEKILIYITMILMVISWDAGATPSIPESTPSDCGTMNYNPQAKTLTVGCITVKGRNNLDGQYQALFEVFTPDGRVVLVLKELNQIIANDTNPDFPVAEYKLEAVSITDNSTYSYSGDAPTLCFPKITVAGRPIVTNVCFVHDERVNLFILYQYTVNGILHHTG